MAPSVGYYGVRGVGGYVFRDVGFRIRAIWLSVFGDLGCMGCMDLVD